MESLLNKLLNKKSKLNIENILIVLVVIYFIVSSIAKSNPSNINDPNDLAKETSESTLSIVLPKESYQVLEVIDGDTIDVSINGEKQRVRLLGIDTPETVDPRKPVQCFGKEASVYLKAMLFGKKVYLISDSSQGDKDKYGRLLRYAFLKDRTFINLDLLTEGYAHEYTYDLPYQYQKAFIAAEKQARESNKGLWNPRICPEN